LKKSDLYQPFFPADIFDDYFHPKKKRKSKLYLMSDAVSDKFAATRRTGDTVNLDEIEDDPEEGEKSGGEASNTGSLADEDYDVDEEYDNDYAENYFDNGENDDFDDLGGGAGGGEDGGGKSLKAFADQLLTIF
jgi:DNA-directed RNA polymerase III subunit RPC7